MMDHNTILAVLAHPDDESLAAGGALARYAAEGVEVHLVTATRGERGRYFDETDRPSDREVGLTRERELRAAAAVTASADPAYGRPGGTRPHRVSKLYYLVEDARSWALFERAFRRLSTRVDGVDRVATAWPEWAITTRVEVGEHWRSVWQAVRRHETQMAIYSGLDELTEAELAELWSRKSLYRAFSLVNGGREVETDLLQGLR